MSTTTEIIPKLNEIHDKLKIYVESIDANVDAILSQIDQLQQIPCTPSELKISGLHLIINSLRKSPNGKIAEAAKNLVNYWRAAAMASPGSSVAASPAAAEADPKALVQIAPPTLTTISSTTSPSTATTSAADENDHTVPTGKRTLQQPFILGLTGSKGRDAIQKLFYSVFDIETLEAQVRCELAITIEAALFKHYLAEGQEYKDRVRLLLANLRDPKNTDFRESIIDGLIDPSELPTISQASMASKRVQQSLHDLADYQLQARKTDLGGGQGVDMFPCPKCKGRNTSFFQKQTRSADEPMTIFCTCLLCRTKWRIY